VLSEDEQRVLTAVGYQPTDIDIIADRSGFAMADLASIILSLELSGFVLMEAGGYQRRQA
jgi:predicted Rossmann fold nucleotide-binding protein DprA/Smf involved in DNA uptake